jgi:hypothetical protein
MSSGDDKVFAYAGNDFESAFNAFVKDQSKKYATDLAGFFSQNGTVTDDQVNKLVGEITQVIKEYGTQLAAGKNVSIDDLTSKLHVNNVEMSIGDINKMVATINDINPSKMILDSHADFAVAVVLNLYFIKRYTGFTLNIPETIKIAIAGLSMGVAVFLINQAVSLYNSTLAAIAAMTVGCVVYVLVLIFTGALVEKDIRRMPAAGNKVADVMLRLGWLKK